MRSNMSNTGKLEGWVLYTISCITTVRPTNPPNTLTHPQVSVPNMKKCSHNTALLTLRTTHDVYMSFLQYRPYQEHYTPFHPNIHTCFGDAWLSSPSCASLPFPSLNPTFLTTPPPGAL
jgi:hypothetical protein